MQKFGKAAATLAITMVACTTTAFAASVDFQTHGFPTVAAKAAIPAGQGATIQTGGVKVTIPSGTFSDPVEFELLDGPLSNFAGKAPAGQTPVFDFAFKVIDQKTGALVMSFGKPVVFSYTDAQVNAHSLYYNVDPTGTYTLNPVSPRISGDTLKHGIKGAPVGWVITSPSADVQNGTSPVTGLPFVNDIFIGAGLLLGGGLLLGFRRKAK